MKKLKKRLALAPVSLKRKSTQAELKNGSISGDRATPTTQPFPKEPSISTAPDRRSIESELPEPKERPIPTEPKKRSWLTAFIQRPVSTAQKRLSITKALKRRSTLTALLLLNAPCLFAQGNEWIEKKPFKFYKMRIDKKEIVHLTLPEVNTIYDKDMTIERLDKVRDIFIFCCYTGMAFTDVEHLRREHLIRDEDDKLWIIKPHQKTSVVSKIPLLPRPLKILKKWEKDETVRLSGRLLPVPTNQRMNAYLKEIAILCGITKNLTTHCARRTLASNSMEFGMPIAYLEALTQVRYK